jgi:hypothetical protein
MNSAENTAGLDNAAWWNSLTDAQKQLAHIPVGYQHNLLIIA